MKPARGWTGSIGVVLRSGEQSSAYLLRCLRQNATTVSNSAGRLKPVDAMEWERTKGQPDRDRHMTLHTGGPGCERSAKSRVDPTLTGGHPGTERAGLQLGQKVFLDKLGLALVIVRNDASTDRGQASIYQWLEAFGDLLG